MTPTADELLDGAWPTRAEGVVWQVIDKDGVVTGEADAEGGSISVSTNSAASRTANGVTFPPGSLADVNPLTDRLAPYWTLQDGTGYPLGVFYFATNPVAYADGGEWYTPNLMDGSLLLQEPTAESYSIRSNALVQGQMAAAVEAAGVTDYTVDETDARTLDPLAFPPGTTWHEVIHGLCELAGFLPPYFDNTGRLVLRATPDLNNASPDLTYDGRRIVAGTRIATDAVLGAPNRHLVIATGATETEIAAEAFVPASAPNSPENGARVITEVHRVQGIETTAQAQRMAQSYATQAPDLRELTFTGPPDPRHDVWTLVEVNGVLWVERAWSLTLDPGGPHTHSLDRGCGCDVAQGVG